MISKSFYKLGPYYKCFKLFFLKFHNSFTKNTDKLLEGINAARNILLFPKKRLIGELQSQKNMVIFFNSNILHS